MLSSELQPEKAELPILSSAELFPNVTVVKLLQPLKAEDSILFTLSKIFTALIPAPLIKVV